MEKPENQEKQEYTNGKFFIGFVPYPVADTRNIWVTQHIWTPFFHNKGPKNCNPWDDLRERLNIDLKDSPLSARISGSKAWASYGTPFLDYRNNYEEYMKNWVAKPLNRDACLNLFMAFRETIPEAVLDEDGRLKPVDPKYELTARFLPAAMAICKFLEDVDAYYKLPLNEYDDKWVHAGMFSLICLFLQNGKRAVPQFFTPPTPPSGLNASSDVPRPPSYTPDSLKMILEENSSEKKRESVEPEEEKVICPTFSSSRESFGAPETGVLPFDLFSHAQNFFQDQIPEDIAITSVQENQHSSIITPAEIHRKQIQFSKTYTLNNPFQVFQSGLFLIDKHLFRKNPSSHQCFIRQKLRAIPYRTDAISREYQIETNCFEDNMAIDAVFLDCKEELHFCYAIPVRFSDTGINWPGASAKGKNYFTLSIDEYGHSKQHHLEHMLDAFQIAPLQQENVYRPAQRTATVSFRREYLDYQFINVDTMVEIPITQSRNEATGEYQLNLTVPCPCTLAIIRNAISSLTPEEAELLQVSGYLHGIYGLKKNQDLAIAIMKAKAGYYPQLAFQYGAYLRTHGSINDAESHLRQAAEHGIPGAQFELAALLKEKNTTEALVESEQLLDILWKQGYRTYGVHTSVDLLNKYST